MLKRQSNFSAETHESLSNTASNQTWGRPDFPANDQVCLNYQSKTDAHCSRFLPNAGIVVTLFGSVSWWLNLTR
jgi:hypothetical protein